jgi:hypothetical protein
MYLFLFAIVGAMRGWAKELLVSFSVILSIFIITVLETYIPFVRDFLIQTGGIPNFWLRSSIVLLLAFFGYQTPNLQRLAGARFARERLQDTLLGLFIGALNGYLIVGTLWFFLHESGYPFPNIFPPTPGDPIGDSALELISWLPPRWLGIPSIYFAVAIAFAFVVIVFI